MTLLGFFLHRSASVTNSTRLAHAPLPFQTGYMIPQGDDHITYFARTNHRNAGVPFGIRLRDRRAHMYLCGKTGTGKTSVFGAMLEQDIMSNVGCDLFDPHGDLAERVARLAAARRPQDLTSQRLQCPHVYQKPGT